MRNENEIHLKRAYWNGAFDTLNTPENAKSDKFAKDKLIAQTWLASLDWILGQSDEAPDKSDQTGNGKVGGAD